MTNEEKQQVIRVCGKDFAEKDIPTYIRNRDEEDLKKIINYQKESIDMMLTNMFGEGGKEEIKNYYKPNKHYEDFKETE